MVNFTNPAGSFNLLSLKFLYIIFLGLIGTAPNIEQDANIIWVDSDPNVHPSTGLLEAQNWRVACFNETADALNALQQGRLNPVKVNCVITSMMERGGRRKRGLLNGLQMLEEMKIIWQDKGTNCPLIAIISVTADEQVCKEHGASIVVYGDRQKMLLEVIDKLNKSLTGQHREKWREPSLLPCLELQAIAKAYLDTFCDHCFCRCCEPKRIWERCGEKYALPIGYYRYGLLVRNEYNERRVDVESWPVAYYGTRKQDLKSILRHRRILFPGEKLDDGTALPVRVGQCHSFSSPVIYVSPTVLYSQHDVYALPDHFEYGSSSYSKNYMIKTVLQCRVKPGSFKKCRETLGFNNEIIDKDFSNNEVEWIVSDKTGIVPYGLLIGIFSQ